MSVCTCPLCCPDKWAINDYLKRTRAVGDPIHVLNHAHGTVVVQEVEEVGGDAPKEVRWLGVTKLAKAYGISRRSIYNWLYAGKLRWRRNMGGTLMIDSESVWVDYECERTPFRRVGATRGAEAGQYGTGTQSSTDALGSVPSEAHE